MQQRRDNLYNSEAQEKPGRIPSWTVRWGNLAICVAFGGLLAGTFSCTSVDKDSFLLEGRVVNARESERIYLFYPVSKNGMWFRRIDTAEIRGGKFRFGGVVPETVPAFLVFDDMDEIEFYLEPAKLRLRMDRCRPYEYTLSGGSVEKENMELRDALGEDLKIHYERQRDVYELNMQWLAAAEQDKDSLWTQFYDAVQRSKAVFWRLDSLRFDFASNHSDYVITPNLLLWSAKAHLIDNKVLQQLYNRLPEKSRNNAMGQLAGIQLGFFAGETGWEVGSLAPDFSRTDATGQQIKLSDYRGKNYVLLDFWASWCGPCLRELPKVKALNTKYGERGLRVIGISSDDERDKWLHAIDAHELTAYPQILSVEPHPENYKLFFAEQEDIGARYEIMEIPSFVLIDMQGRIIARWQHIEPEQFAYLDGILQ